MGQIYSTSWNSCTVNSSKLTSGLPFFFRAILMAPCTPRKSLIIEPIMPPGRPHPTSNELLIRLPGLIYRPRKSSMNSCVSLRASM